jgi:preprotein translocase subunit SecG
MWALQILFILVCIFLAFFILIQPARGEGIAGAFGGVGSESFFGTKAHQHMSRLTIFLSIAVLILALWINWIARGGPSEDTKAPENKPAAPAPPPK